MHIAIQTALVIPALMILLTGCAMFRIAGAITARHAAEHLVENRPAQAKDALSMAYKLRGVISGKTYIDGMHEVNDRYELCARLHNFLDTLIVDDLVLKRDIIDLVSVMKIDMTAPVSYDKVKDIRYMVDAFIEVAERGLADVSATQNSEGK